MLLFAIYNYASTLTKIGALSSEDIFIAIIYCPMIHNAYYAVLRFFDDYIHALAKFSILSEKYRIINS